MQMSSQLCSLDNDLASLERVAVSHYYTILIHLSAGTREASLIDILTQLSCYVNINVSPITGCIFPILKWQKELFKNQFFCFFWVHHHVQKLACRQRGRERELSCSFLNTFEFVELFTFSEACKYSPGTRNA